MAGGLGQGGGVFSTPNEVEPGYDSWAQMSGVHPDSPLVGGRAGLLGAAGIDVTGQSRRVAIAAADPLADLGAPMRSHWSELGNLQGNPIGWILLATILYLALTHIALHGAGRVGKLGASASFGRA